jgi:RNA polymerase sigma-70 factor, ECF subfamily
VAARRKGVMVTGENSAASLSVTLIARIRSGEGAAEEELVTLYRQPVFAISAARTGDREVARDLTQEVLMAVLKAARSGQIRESEKLAAFIQGTARNLINNYFKSRVRRAESTLEAAENLSNDPVGALEAAERRRLVQAELRSYSVLDQQILLFSLVDGHSLAEVAERLKMSHEAVRARKSRLVRKITKKFGGLSHK